MFHYGRSSLIRLDSCSDAVQRVMNRVIKYVDVSILCGYRNEEDQEQAYKDGFSQVHFPLSDHNKFPSDAVDAGLYRKDIRNVDYLDHMAFGTLNGIIQVCAEEENCVAIWGHDWDHDGNYNEHEFRDRPHWLILTKEEFKRRKEDAKN